jgi:hypothetical protein
LLHYLVDGSPIANVTLHEAVSGIICYRSKVLDVPCIGELIEIDDRILRMSFKPIVDEVGADKTCSASDKKFHKINMVNVLM